MKLKNIILTSILALGCFEASAQEAKTEYVFNPYWNVQAQFGAQYTLGERSFGDLLSPNFQLGGGYQFNQLLGARFSVNAWQSKAGIDYKSVDEKWKWNYVAPMIDATFDLSNVILGYNPERLVSFGVFAGIGLNIGFNNNEANDVYNDLYAAGGAYSGLTDAHKKQNLENIWSGSKTRFVGRAGANVDFRINDKFSVGIEMSANVLNDKYNSKGASNADWYFNTLVGVKYNIGKTYTKRAAPSAPSYPSSTSTPASNTVEKVVEKIVEKPVEVIKIVEKIAPLRRDIFFTINSVTVSKSESLKLKDIVDYLNMYPGSKVVVTGYADKGTGTDAINTKLAQSRAQSIVNDLTKKYGISADRITYSSKGSSEQPFSENSQNRVAICIAE